MEKSDLDNRLTYHPPKPGQPEQYAEIRVRAKSLAELCQKSRELSLAFTKLEESTMRANAAIARFGEAADGMPDPEPSNNYGPEAKP